MLAATAAAHDFDWLVVGSGFGGSTSALRLAEKGYSVGVLESGSRFEDDEFASSTWDLRRYFYLPRLGLRGIFRLSLFKHVTIVSGSGVGGGSLGYANTLYVPPKAFFTDPQWSSLSDDWQAELAEHYAEAERMLGVTTYDEDDPADQVLKALGEHLGVSDTYAKTRVGVFLGEPGVCSARSGRTRCGPDRRRPNPTFIPVANDAAAWIAQQYGGIPQSSVMEALGNTPTTAHILGGAIIADSPERGVVDARQRVFGYENLLLCDGSVIPANVGVNPSLTITALAERAMSHVPPAPERGIGSARRERSGAAADRA